MENELQKILNDSDLNVFEPINEKSFEYLKSFDFEFKDFKELQKTIKSIVKVKNLFEKLEIFKNRLRDENIDYKSFFLFE